MTATQDWTRAATHLVTLVERLPADRWEAPALGDWSLRDLLGHTVSAGIREVVSAVDNPATAEDFATPADYYALVQSVDPGTYAAVTAASGEDARHTGRDLGAQQAQEVQALVGRATRKLETVAIDSLVTTAAGGMRLDAWLPTRTFELVVHAIDIARAAAVDDGLPDDLIAGAAGLAGSTATTIGHGRTLLLALTGRGQLPPHYSVLSPSGEPDARSNSA